MIYVAGSAGTDTLTHRTTTVTLAHAPRVNNDTNYTLMRGERDLGYKV
jgi:hypothetical protein